MSAISEVIRLEQDGSLSFGNYEVEEKQKVKDFLVDGNSYNIKTHNEITKLEMNSKMVFESFPGSVVHNFILTDKTVNFKIAGKGSSQITIELESSQEYKVIIDDVTVGSVKSSGVGKINFSVDLTENLQKVTINKV